ncbi:MAG: hypothetical protein RIT27_595 [Pseudomonadota bacterium]
MQKIPLNEWLISTDIGQSIIELEKSWLEQITETWFGRLSLQLGEVGTQPFEMSARINKHAVVTFHQLKQSDICARFDALPFANDSIDGVIVSHILELFADPFEILKEIERILSADKSVVILAVNPYSFYGLWHLAGAWRATATLHSSKTLQKMLVTLGFEITGKYRGMCRPPLQNFSRWRRWQWLEKGCDQPAWGSVYALVAKKQRLVMPTHLVSKIKPKNQWVGVAEPTLLRHDNDASC